MNVYQAKESPVPCAVGDTYRLSVASINKLAFFFFFKLKRYLLSPSVLSFVVFGEPGTSWVPVGV